MITLEKLAQLASILNEAGADTAGVALTVGYTAAAVEELKAMPGAEIVVHDYERGYQIESATVLVDGHRFAAQHTIPAPAEEATPCLKD
jgi:hypothetical protein